MPEGRGRLAAIAEATGLHKNTAFSILKTLMALGYVERRGPSRDYVLGSRAFELATIAESAIDILELTRPLMLRLVGVANESVSLAIPARRHALIVNTVESSFGVRGARYRGHHAAYHASAVGKAILSALPNVDRTFILSELEMVRLTPRTIRAKSGLIRELDRVSTRGYAISLEEEEVGANAVAAPLLGRMGEILGAVAIWGPAPRLNESRLRELGPLIAAECAKLRDGPAAI
jgi:DNA-binding IclR family transcriptional regulator